MRSGLAAGSARRSAGGAWVIGALALIQGVAHGALA